MKVTIVGAGNVGATAADVIASKEIAENVVLLDIKEGFAEGKALDLMHGELLLEICFASCTAPLMAELASISYNPGQN